MGGSGATPRLPFHPPAFPTPMQRTPSKPMAALWMAGWLALMLVMAVAGREALRELNVFQLMEVRSVLGFLLLYPLIRLNGGLSIVKTARLPQHVARNLCRTARLVFRADPDSDRTGGRDRVHHADLDSDPCRDLPRRADDGLEDRSDRTWPDRRPRHRPPCDRCGQSRPTDCACRGSRLRHFHRRGQVADPNRKYPRDRLLDA